jgi:hypothetical protein
VKLDLTVRKEHRRRMFGRQILRRIFELKWKEVGEV